MKIELLGSLSMPLWGELDNLTQGSDQLNIPMGFWSSYQYRSGWAWVFALCRTTVAHSFTFFINDNATELATVTLGTSSNWAEVALTMPSGGLQGLGDYISVRHNTNSEKSSESALHTDEGGRLFAGIYGVE